MVRTAGVFIVACLLLMTDVAFAERAALSEYAVKAAFLVKFAHYVDWPADSSPRSRPFVVGVVGADPFGDVLDRIAAANSKDGRKVMARRFSTAEEAADAADIVFINAADDGELKRALRAMEGRPILTVGEIDQFALQGGMIGFNVEGNTVRFEINVQRAERAGLKMSSQLLKLARIVKKGGAA